MGRQSREGAVQASLLKRGRQKGGQDLPQGVNEERRHVLCAGTQLEHEKKLGARITG
jgi:hypothetical protein